jgi:putative inorganic carbon (hco3(-)) transporter
MAFGAFALYLVLALLRFHEYGDSLSIIPILPILLVVSFAAWLFSVTKTQKSPHLILMGGLGVGILFSFFKTRWVGGAISAVFDYATLAIFFLLLAATANTLKKIRVVIWIYSLSMLVIALHCLQQFTTGVGWTGAVLQSDSRIRYIGFLNDPNDLGAALVIATAFTIFLAFGKKANFVSKILALCATPVYLWSIYLTNSRGAVLGLAVLVIAAFLVSKRKVLSLFALLPLAFLGVAYSPERASEIAVGEASAAGRVDAWYTGFQMLKGNPLFGVGKGQFLENYSLTAHNSFVLVLSELGIFGFYFWFSLVVVSMCSLFRIANANAPKVVDQKHDFQDYRWLGSCAFVAFSGFIACSFFLSISYSILYYFVFGFSAATYAIVATKYPDLDLLPKGRKWLRLLAIEAGGIVGLWLVVSVLLRFGR